MPKNVTIYTTSECPYCKMLKDYLAEKKIEFTGIDVGKDRKAFVAMRDKTGFMSVPVIDIDGKYLAGFDKNALAKELGIA